MIQNKQNKLELTWIGKYDEHKPLEPRILIEDKKCSYGNPETGTLPNGKPWNGNMLIHGDNLLALKALEQDLSGQVKCIYIDPPYNTGMRLNIMMMEKNIPFGCLLCVIGLRYFTDYINMQAK